MRTRSGGATTASPGNNGHALRASPRQGSHGCDDLDYNNPTITARVTRSSVVVKAAHPPPVQSQLPIRQSPRSHNKRPAPHTPATNANVRRSKRARLQSGSYVENTSDDDDDQAETAEWEIDSNPSPRQSDMLHVDHQSQTLEARTYKAPKRHTPARLKLRTTNLGSPRKAAKVPGADIATNGQDVTKPFIPDWTKVPYMIWVDIMEYASIMTIKDDRDKDERNRAQWLLAASTTSRLLSEAALTALYRVPPLTTRGMAHGLTALLLKDPATTMYQYRSKIHFLDINVAEIAIKPYRGEPLDYNALVSGLSRLKFLGFFHWKDEPEWRTMDHNLRWSYPDELFEALEKANPRLTRWIWNRRFLGSDMMDFSQVKRIHQTKPFSRLKRLDLLNFQLPSVLSPPKAAADSEELAKVAQNDQQFVQKLADAIMALPNLEKLSVGYSTIVNNQLFPLLPTNLKSLTLFKCWEVEDNGFASFLLSHGSQLERLSLKHNPALTLSFLTVLKAACPKLKSLSMDFQTFAQREYGYDDPEPYYDWILTPDQTPQWPASLEKLELKNMKKWSAEAAEVFFRSLVDSAPNLLRLRCIDMKIMLDIPIRQRSEFRDKWVPRLAKVFLREQTDPLPIHTLRPEVFRPDHAVMRVSKVSPNKQAQKRSSWAETESPVRLSSRILAVSQEAASQLLSFSAAVSGSSQSSRASSVVRDLRTGLSRPSYAEPDTDDDDDDDMVLEDDEEVVVGNDEEAETKKEAEPILFRQGLCEKVEILIDNQKLAEHTYKMNDFLDHEEGDSEDDASDEDWNGNDSVDEDVRLAW
ncbi:F-box protein At-B [Cladorrhinum sp. PSN259]|nr:F-box protein At-B [Cladorrhinum sp. PSN259]